MVYVNATRKAREKSDTRNKIVLQFSLINNRPPNLRALDSLREIFVGNANKILSQSTRQRRIVSYIRPSSFVNNPDSESVYSAAHN
jgi:hypothetical protein